MAGIAASLLQRVLARLAIAARAQGLNHKQWAIEAGIRPETLSRLKRRQDCDLATLVKIARAAGCTLTLDVAGEIGSGGPLPSRDDLMPARMALGDQMALARMVLEQPAATRERELARWRAGGPPFFMAGVAVIASQVVAGRKDELRDTAEQLHPGITSPAAFRHWIKRSPMDGDGFIRTLLAVAHEGAEKARNVAPARRPTPSDDPGTSSPSHEPPPTARPKPRPGSKSAAGSLDTAAARRSRQAPGAPGARTANPARTATPPGAPRSRGTRPSSPGAPHGLRPAHPGRGDRAVDAADVARAARTGLRPERRARLPRTALDHRGETQESDRIGPGAPARRPAPQAGKRSTQRRIEGPPTVLDEARTTPGRTVTTARRARPGFPTKKAADIFMATFVQRLRKQGWQVDTERPQGYVNDRGRRVRGRIDVVATRDGKTVAYELDRAGAREKSIEKLKLYVEAGQADASYVVCRNGKSLRIR